jgi:sugar phosphate isomerase/epimerase
MSGREQPADRPATSIRLACRNDSFPMLPHDQAVDFIAALGFDAADLMVIGNRPLLPVDEILADPRYWAGLFGERLRRNELELGDVFAIPWSDFATMAPNALDDGGRRRGVAFFEQALALVEALGGTGLTILPGIDWPGERHEDSLARAAEELQRRAIRAKERGIRLSIEPHVGSVCESPADTLELCRMAPDLELTLDYGHFLANRFEENDVEPLLPYARSVHARGAAPGRLQVPLKRNTLDFPRLVHRLVEQDYRGCLLVEYLWAGQDGRLDPLDITTEIVLLRDCLRALIAGEPWEYPTFTWPVETADEVSA